MSTGRSFVPLAFLMLAFVFLLGAAALDAQGSRPVAIVAAENFYGNIAAQIGGDRVSVTSIVSDPNVDPHEYESTVADAKAVADADLVIENGGGYDGWMDKLIAASPRSSRIVLKAFDLAVNTLPDNVHVWYSVENAQAVGLAVSRHLERMLPDSAGLFARNDRAFQQSLETVLLRMTRFSARHAGTPVGLTETAFLYQANPLGLRVLTPFEYQKAVAEGNDPPADAVVETENQITQKKIRILIYNEQTVSPITARAQEEAKAAGIPVVGVSETMPSGETYQGWMLRQLEEIQAALEGAGS